jgi:hypothetical protein
MYMKTVILNEFLSIGTKETANHLNKNRYLLEE